MKYGKRISAIIPTLNEEVCLPKVLNSIPDVVDEIIIVDGHSTDHTVKIAREFGCKVIFDNIGKGSALIKGVEESKGDYIIMMDADLSHRPSEIEAMLISLHKGNDICMGSRFIKGGGSKDISWFRYFGNKFFVAIVNIIFHARYTDLCYGYRAMTSDAARKLKLKAKRFSIETEISIKAAKLGMKVNEVPSFEKSRGHGTSRLKAFRDGFDILKMIIKEVFY